MNMNKYVERRVAVILLSVAVAGGNASVAGSKVGKRVTVDVEKSEARGVLAESAARIGAEDIGCRVETFGAAGEQTRVECSATDELNNTLSCVSERPAYAKVARALPDHGLLWFRADLSGECTFLQSRVGSPYLP